MIFTLLEGRFAVARLAADDEIPSWSACRAFTSVTRTPDELSIVCGEEHVPDEVRAERGWSCLALTGPIPFETTGVAAEFTRVLAQRGLSVLVVSTFDTDYVLVKDAAAATEALRAAGHEVRQNSDR